MVRKSQRKKNATVQNISIHSDKSDNDTNDDGLKCKYCDVVSISAKEKQKHEQGCDAQVSANVFITSDGKLRFLCTVSDFVMIQDFSMLVRIDAVVEFSIQV